MIVASIAPDAHSANVGAWLLTVEGALAISDLAALEVSAVISRAFRTGRLDEAAARHALSDFDALRSKCERLANSADNFSAAEAFVRDFSTKLAAADALHLAGAKGAGARLATCDKRLARAAVASLVPVVDLAVDPPK